MVFRGYVAQARLQKMHDDALAQESRHYYDTGQLSAAADSSMGTWRWQAGTALTRLPAPA